MIATGGLLRINARRQDSLRAKTHRPHPHKKKSKNKRRSEVVVVKGKLKLCSLSGLVAALGVLVLMMGVVMAALGYWPRDGLFFRVRPQEGTIMASVSFINSTSAPAQRGEDLQAKAGADDTFNQTETINGTNPTLSFLEDFLNRYLYSDRLKVLGPLIMGIGIFLFICANAVLHENRDKKTKVINLRDIYSTVIDLHSLRRPRPSASSCSAPRRPSSNPLNGLVNYVQSKSLDIKPCSYPASLMKGREGQGVRGGAGTALLKQQLLGSPGGGDGDSVVGEEKGDSVFSIYQEAPPPDSSSLDLSPSPPFVQSGGVSFFTLPLRRPPPPPTPRRRHSAQARTGWREGRGQDKSLPLPSTPPLTPPLRDSRSAASCCSSSLQRETRGGSKAHLLSFSSLSPPHLSLLSLSHLMSPSPDVPYPISRRRSLPSGCVAIGYSKLTHREDESFESSEVTSTFPLTSEEVTSSHPLMSEGVTLSLSLTSQEVTSQKFSNREKLKMILQPTTRDDQPATDSLSDITTLTS